MTQYVYSPIFIINQFLIFPKQIYHPNIYRGWGDVCLDVIDEAWSADYDLDMIFEYFLPQLLKEPNPSSPANSGAAQILNDRYLEGAMKKLWCFESTFFQTSKKNIFYRILFSYTFKKTLLAWIRLRVHLRFIQNEIKTMSRQCLSRPSHICQDYIFQDRCDSV